MSVTLGVILAHTCVIRAAVHKYLHSSSKTCCRTQTRAVVCDHNEQQLHETRGRRAYRLCCRSVDPATHLPKQLTVLTHGHTHLNAAVVASNHSIATAMSIHMAISVWHARLGGEQQYG